MERAERGAIGASIATPPFIYPPNESKDAVPEERRPAFDPNNDASVKAFALPITRALFLIEIFLPIACDQDCIAFENDGNYPVDDSGLQLNGIIGPRLKVRRVAELDDVHTKNNQSIRKDARSELWSAQLWSGFVHPTIGRVTELMTLYLNK